MSNLIRRRPATAPAGIDGVFDEWLRALQLRRPFGISWDWPGEDLIRVDEYRDGNTEVIRAELPGIDPDSDLEVMVADGMLRISAERKVEQRTEDKGYSRHELRYGSFTRTLPMPEGASEADVAATYKDGILEIRVPVPEQAASPEPTKIAVTKG